jgi:hypothetical protein
MIHDFSVGDMLGVGPVLGKITTWKAYAHVGKVARVRKMHMLENKHMQYRHTWRKIITCKRDVHPEEEIMRGVHARRPIHSRIRVL